MIKTPFTQESKIPVNRSEIRLAMGEAWMHCNECGGKLWSFDGDEDASRGCPYKRSGRCEPPTST
jgi:hypothetical protein